MGSSSSKLLDRLEKENHLFVKNPNVLNVLRNVRTLILDKKALFGSGVVTSVWLNGETFNSYQIHSCRSDPNLKCKIDPTLMEMHNCVALCCDKRIEEGLPHERQIISFMDSLKDTEKVKYYYTERHNKAYSTESMFTASVGKHLDQTQCVYVMGSVEEVVPHCSHILKEGKAVEFTEEWHNRVSQYCNEFNSPSHNIVALAMRVTPNTEDEKEVRQRLQSTQSLTEDYIFLGMIQITDNVKPQTTDMMKLCKENNIRVIFLSEEDTVLVKKQAIAAGIVSQADSILSGDELKTLSHQEKRDMIERDFFVVAQCSLEDRDNVVRMIQKASPEGRVLISGLHGSDIPAMRLADVGAAFDSSCPLVKAVCDVIMMNNHLSSLVHGLLMLHKETELEESEEQKVASPSHWRISIPQLCYKEHLMSLDVLIESNTDSHISTPSNPRGLLEGEALRRLVSRGENVLPKHPQHTFSFLESQMPSHVDIIREGKEYRVESKKLVEGDVIHLTAGQHIPADVRFIQCSEDAGVSKTLFVAHGYTIHRCTVESTNDLNPFLSCNMGFCGTFLVSGEVYALVVRTGSRMAISQLCFQEQQSSST